MLENSLSEGALEKPKNRAVKDKATTNILKVKDSSKYQKPQTEASKIPKSKIFSKINFLTAIFTLQEYFDPK